jgi:hypothetical protein
MKDISLQEEEEEEKKKSSNLFSFPTCHEEGREDHSLGEEPPVVEPVSRFPRADAVRAVVVLPAAVVSQFEQPQIFSAPCPVAVSTPLSSCNHRAQKSQLWINKT